jgi:serine/threonine protein kinase
MDGNNANDYNYPPLSLQNVKSNLFANRTNKNKANTILKQYSLLNDSTLKALSHTNAKIIGIKVPVKKLGEGNYGYVTSAVINLQYPTRIKELVSAVKVSLSDEVKYTGIPDDIILECSVYARLLKSNNTSKALFAKLTEKKSSVIMEHYSTSINDLLKGFLFGDKKFKLVRAVLFQIVNGLNEMHKLNFIHKDLKPQNILVSHDGRILIADFGLTTYTICGNSTPQKFYYKITTPTIEPPEGNNALKDNNISKSYDIWSLGCVLDFLMFGDMKFDMWKTIGDHYRDTVTTKHYNDILKNIYERYESNDLPEYGDLIKELLKFQPKDRPTTEEILKNPLFKGLTLATAIEDVSDAFISIKTLPNNTRKIGDKGRNKIISNTVKNVGTLNHNTGFFQIKSLEKAPSKISENLSEIKSSLVKKYLELMNANRSSIYSMLHALELHNRYAYTKDPTLDIKMTKIFRGIAIKLSPYRVHNYDTDILYDDSRYNSEEIKTEATVISALHGDMLPQVGGLVDIVLRALIPRNTEDKKTILTRFLLNLATTDKSIQSCIDDDVDKTTVDKLNLPGILDTKFKRLPEASQEQLIQYQKNAGTV